MKVGDLIRVETLVDGDGRPMSAYSGKLAIVQDVFSEGDGYIQMLKPAKGDDGEWQWDPRLGDRGSIVTIDELTDEECAALARWRLSHEAG